MVKQLQFRVTDQGVKAEAVGFTGSHCEELTLKFLQAAGLQPDSQELKEEYYQAEHEPLRDREVE